MVIGALPWVSWGLLGATNWLQKTIQDAVSQSPLESLDKDVKDLVGIVSCSTLGRRIRGCWIGNRGILRAIGWPQDLMIYESRGCA